MDPEEKKRQQAERQKLYYEANKAKILARRRELYAAGGKEKDKEYYLAQKEKPEYKERMRINQRRYREKHRPETYDKEAVRIARNRKIGATLASKKIKKKKTSWLDSIPDVTQAFGVYEQSQRQDTPALLTPLFQKTA